MGSYCSVLNDTDQTIFVKFSANRTAFTVLTFVAAAAAIIATGGIAAPMAAAGVAGGGVVAAGAFLAASTAMETKLKADGYTELKPREKYTSSKWTLSLVMQASIVKKKETGADVGTMTVWTGTTDGSTMEYKASDCSYTFKSYAST